VDRPLRAPRATTKNETLAALLWSACVQNLPPVQSPEVFGMHDNVNISKELQETKHMIDNVLLATPGKLCTPSTKHVIDNVLLAQGRLKAGTRTGSHTDERLADISSNILNKVGTWS